MKRGDIYLANLTPRTGSEQSGRRPVIIVSHNSLNQTESWRSIIVIPVSTSTLQAKRKLTIVQIPKGNGNLSKDSIAVCHQVTTLDRAKFENYIGTLPEEILKQIEEGLKSAMDFS